MAALSAIYEACDCRCRCAAGEESDDEQLHMQQQEQLLEDVLEDEQQVG